MGTSSWSRFYRVVSLFAFVGTPSCAVLGLRFVVNAFTKHGSVTRDILVGSTGVLLLLISPILFTFGVAAWRVSNRSNQAE